MTEAEYTIIFFEHRKDGQTLPAEAEYLDVINKFPTKREAVNHARRACAAVNAEPTEFDTHGSKLMFRVAKA